MQVLKKFGIAGGVLAAAAISMAIAVPANADTGAQPGDAVGVGSDTVQNAADFVFDGAPGIAGAYNATGNVDRVDNVFATGDANGRALYDGTCGDPKNNPATGLGTFCSSTSNLVPNVISPSVILRAGSRPVVRPNGTGQGVAALTNDSTGGPGYKGLPANSINYARMSRLPNAGETSNCSNISGCGSLHIYQFADDNLGVARVTAGFHGPAGLTADTLYKIYTCAYKTWGDIPGYTGSSATSTIHPLLPSTSSGTGSFFLTDLNQSQGLTGLASPGNCIRTVQEHDPSGIYADPSPADAIEPFSAGKLSLINNSYYTNGVSYSGTNGANGAFTPNYLSLESGATTGQPNGSATPGGNYSSTRGLYFVVRQTDVAKSAATDPSNAFQPGSTLTLTQALFSDSQSAIRSTIGKSQISQAGFTPDYVDCGPNNSAGC